MPNGCTMTALRTPAAAIPSVTVSAVLTYFAVTNGGSESGGYEISSGDDRCTCVSMSMPLTGRCGSPIRLRPPKPSAGRPEVSQPPVEPGKDFLVCVSGGAQCCRLITQGRHLGVEADGNFGK